MESQQLLDSLTAHIALYHSSSNPNPNPNSGPRSAILRWFSALSGPQRQSALTVVDPDFVSVLLLMLRRLRSAGVHGHFFLLPDLPQPSAPGLPSLCFRRSRGLLRRAVATDPHSPVLARSLRLFSSKDGDLFPPSSDCPLDSITVAEDFVSTVDGFVGTMDGISGWRFLRDEESGLGKPWAELPWLRDKGYYSMEAFVANKLEIALRLSWLNSAGGKKQKGGKGKEKERAVGFASVAANAFWRKKGCLDWWMGMDPGRRKDFVGTFLGKAAKFLVLVVHFFRAIFLRRNTFEMLQTCNKCQGEKMDAYTSMN